MASMLMATITVEAWTTALVGLLAAVGGLLWEPLLGWVRRRIAIRRRRASLSDSDSRVTLEVGPLHISASFGPTLDNLANDPIDGPRIYVSEIAMSNFRCYEAVAATLNHPGKDSSLLHENVNLILGDNGTGKSTLLKAIAISALGPILDSSGFVPYHLIRSPCSLAQIEGAFVVDEPESTPTTLTGPVEIVRTGDYEKVAAKHDRDAWAEIFEEANLSFLVLGYGVNRRVADDQGQQTLLERSRRRRRYQRIASLFDESAILTPLSAWLPDLDSKRQNEVEELLEHLLPDVRLVDSTAEETTFHTRGQNVPYRALSDGYRSFVGWVGDLLCQIDAASNGELPFREVGGIVLVDEVDLLLHPAWQREVVPNIASALPKLQFIFTTHSPIVAGTLQANNILLARSSSKSGSSLDRVNAEIHGLNAEQILLSSYFELESTRALGTRDELAALAEKAMGGDDDAAVKYLRILAGERGDAESTG